MKMKFKEKEYDFVLNKILKNWSVGSIPNNNKILNELKNNNELMKEELGFYKELNKECLE